MRNRSSKIFYSIFYPSLFVAILWIVKLFEIAFEVKLAWYGLYPRTLNGLIGIVFSPLIHGDMDHLISNSLPLLILGTIMFFFYRSIAFKVFFWVYLMTGVWVWAAARNSYHIGASGIIYGFIGFLFFSGIFRKDTRLLALSMFVVFVYGGTVWGMFPVVPQISFESHFLGALAGLITAYNFRKEGPPAQVYDFGDEEENEKMDVSGTQIHTFTDENVTDENIHPHYTYKPDDDSNDKESDSNMIK